MTPEQQQLLDEAHGALSDLNAALMRPADQPVPEGAGSVLDDLKRFVERLWAAVPENLRALLVDAVVQRSHKAIDDAGSKLKALAPDSGNDETGGAA